jgi:membrane-associated protease RseP (regulator of RpoE activity)
MLCAQICHRRSRRRLESCRRPASNTPHLAASSSPTQQIRQIVQCGGTMYAVGSFSSIKQGSGSFARTDIVSFSASSPYTVTSWVPAVVGSTQTNQDGADAINSIAFSGGNCADAYIGGNFTKVNGTSVTNIAEISTSTGNVVTGFAHAANGSVDTLAAVGSHLLVGGAFTSINGASIPRMVSLNPSTGLSDGFLNLSIAGSHVFNQQLSHGGTLDLVEGNVSSVGGFTRHQMFMLNVGGSKASVTGWTSPTFNIACSPQTFWARGGPGRRTTPPCTWPPRATKSRASAGPGRARPAARVTRPWRSRPRRRR